MMRTNNCDELRKPEGSQVFHAQQSAETSPPPTYATIASEVYHGTGEPMTPFTATIPVPPAPGRTCPGIYLTSSSSGLAIKLNADFDEGKGSAENPQPDHADASPLHTDGSRFVLADYGRVFFGLPRIISRKR